MVIKLKNFMAHKKEFKESITMKSIKWIFLIVLLSTYSSCHWDYHLSNYLFEEYCNEEGRTGQFIYERVALGDEYFMPIPEDPRRIDYDLIIKGNLMINRERLEQDYYLSKYRERILLSEIGPISSNETSIIRRRDNKLLGKSVSLFNKQGWLAERNILGHNEGERCPGGYDKNAGLYEDSLLHTTLIENIFTAKQHEGIK